MEPLKEGTLTITPEVRAGTLLLTWRGRSTSREPGKVLRPYLLGLLLQATQCNEGLALTFVELEHFNSSTVAELIFLANACREKKVPLQIVYDASKQWQALSFVAIEKALKAFGAGDLVKIVPVKVP